MEADGTHHRRRQNAGHQQHDQQLGLDADPRQQTPPGKSRRSRGSVRRRSARRSSSTHRCGPWTKAAWASFRRKSAPRRRLSGETWRPSSQGGNHDMAATNDPFDLQRFVDAQDRVYDTVVDELRSGAGSEATGCGSYSRNCAGWAAARPRSAFGDLVARRGARLPGARGARPAAAGVHAVGRRRSTAARSSEIFGWPDDLKVRSSMTLFARRPTTTPTFVAVLDKFYGGEEDPATLSSCLSQARRDDQPAVRLDLGLGDDVLRRRARARDDPALTEARTRSATPTTAHRRR